jgi:hypothetical protein
MKMCSGSELKVSAVKTLHAHFQGVNAVCSGIKRKSVDIIYGTKRLEYSKQYFLFQNTSGSSRSLS